MNIKRTIFWVIFVIVLGLIVWGVIVSMNRGQSNRRRVGTMPPVSSVDHILASTSTPHTSAAETGHIEIVEYSDFQCPACQLYYPIVKHALASSTVPIRFVYRHYPLPQHKNARPAAYASEAAALQGKFWEMSDLIFSNHTQWTELSDPTPIFRGYAERLGLDMSAYEKDIDSSSVRSAVDASADGGVKAGIYQTPTFFVNGKMIDNPRGYDEFVKAIQPAAR